MSRPSSSGMRSSIVYVPKRTSVSNYRSSGTVNIISSATSSTLTWEEALNDVLPVLKIQYRSELGISEFLLSPSKVNQLKFSSLARADYNRRCIREECDFEVYSPPRARRIAKEVAIDYIRKYVDEQEDKFEMVRKIQDIQAERDDVIEQVATFQFENEDLIAEKDALLVDRSQLADQKEAVEATLLDTTCNLQDTKKKLEEAELSKKDLELTLCRTKDNLSSSKCEGSQLKDDLDKLKDDFQRAQSDNNVLRNECQDAWKVSSERRDQIGNLKTALESARADAARANAQVNSNSKMNTELTGKNKDLCEKNLNLRDTVNVYRAREEELRTLVQIQLNILSPERTAADVQGTVRRSPSPKARNIKTPEAIEELREEDEEQEIEQGEDEVEVSEQQEIEEEPQEESEEKQQEAEV